MVRRFEDLDPDEQRRVNEVRQEMLLLIAGRLGAVALANIAALEGKPQADVTNLKKGVVTAVGGLADIGICRTIYTRYYQSSDGFPWPLAFMYAGIGALGTIGAQNLVDGEAGAAFWAIVAPAMPVLYFFASCDSAYVDNVAIDSVDPEVALFSMKDIIVKAFRRQAGTGQGPAGMTT